MFEKCNAGDACHANPANIRKFSQATERRERADARGRRLAVADPTEAQLRSLREGDYVIIIPPPSKSDQFAIAWGSAPIYLAWHAAKKVCAARELQQLELQHPVRGAARRTTPLFTHADGKMFTRAWLAKAVALALPLVDVPEERAKTLTLHSFRRFLACALLAVNTSEPTICALLRWRSTKSLAAYAAMNAGAYAGHIDAAATAEIDSIRTANISRVPVTSSIEVAANMVGAEKQLLRAAGLTDDQAADDVQADSD